MIRTREKIMKKAILLVWFLVLLANLTGCTFPKQFRTDYRVCSTPEFTFSTTCDSYAIQSFGRPTPPGFSLSIIEFDDQGKFWKREQKKAVLEQLESESKSNDLLLVVFVHGWQNNAAPNNERLETFRKILARIARNEARINEAQNKEARRNNLPEVHPRKVAGVYLGWRGESVWLPGLKHLATFWDRKNTAYKIGHGGVTEVLSDFEKLISDRQKETENLKANNLVIIGHSFGGLIVHNALTQILENRFVKTPTSGKNTGTVGGFGNLVVLINPAFEALEMASLSDMSTERKDYSANQMPVLAVLTSEADNATKIAFPLGRVFSTLFERVENRSRRNEVTGLDEEISTNESNLSAIGHFEPYRTHRLYPSIENHSNETDASESDVISALSASDAWKDDKPGSKIQFKTVTLERTVTSAGRNPYLLIKVDKQLIPDHSNIDDPRILSFLGEMVVITTTPEMQKQVFKQSINAKE